MKSKAELEISELTAGTLHIASQLAMAHIGDNDILGKMARSLITAMEAEFPEILEWPNNKKEMYEQ